MAGVWRQLDLDPGNLPGLEGLDLEPAYRRMALLLTSAYRRSFAESRSPDGVPWLPLKRPSRRRGGARAKPLRDKGILMASGTAKVTGKTIGWGTNVGYASFHQRGTRTIPARPFVPDLTPELRETLTRILAEQIDRALMKSVTRAAGAGAAAAIRGERPTQDLVRLASDVQGLIRWFQSAMKGR